MSESNVIDLSNKVFPNPDINFEDDPTTSNDIISAYKFSFTFDGADANSGTDVNEDVSTFNQLGAVNTQPDIATTYISPALNDVVYVRNENAWYQWNGVGWGFYSHNQVSYTNDPTATDTQDITTKVVPLNMKLVGNLKRLTHPTYSLGSDFNFTALSNYLLPCSAMGMTGDVLTGFNRPANPTSHTYSDFIGSSKIMGPKPILVQAHVVNSLGLVFASNDSSDKVYLASSSIYDGKGNTISNRYKQYWNDPDNSADLYNAFWLAFVLLMANAVAIDWQVLLDAQTAYQMDMNNDVYFINGLNFLCYSANIIMPFPAISTMRLVRVM